MRKVSVKLARAARKKRVSRPRRARAPARRLPARKEDYARVVEGNETSIVTDATGNYGLTYTTQLSEFQRAQEVAHAYKYYRCAKIELIFVPYANFATTNGVAAGRLPQMYFTVDRVANVQIAPTESEMQERGISPKLFRNTMKFSWRPNLVQHVQMETNQPADGGGNPLGINVINAINSVPLFNKWLPTQQSFGFRAPAPAETGIQVTQMSSNPYALKYYGATACINVENGGAALAVGDLIQKVTWEFKGPRALKTNAPVREQYVSEATSMINPGVVANTQPTNYP